MTIEKSRGNAVGGMEQVLSRLGIEHPLAAIPAHLAAVLEVEINDESAFDKLHKILQREPAYAARVLSVANSLVFGETHEVSTVKAALVRLGTATTKNLLLSVALTEHLATSKPILLHSVATAAFAHRLCLESRLANPEEALCAGLLHDVGKLILSQATKIDPSLKTVLTTGGIFSVEREREVFGTDHLEVGVWFAGALKLPARLIEVIAHHHEAGDASPVLVQLIGAVDEWTQNYYATDFTRAPDTEPIIEHMERRLGLTRNLIESVAERIPEDIAALTSGITSVAFDAGELIRTLQRANVALGEVNTMAEMLRRQSQQQARQLQFLQDLSMVATTAVGQRQVCDSVVSLTSRKLGLGVVSIQLRNARGRPYIESAVGLPSELIGNPDVEAGGPIASWVLSNREGLLMTDLTSSSEFHPSPYWMRYTTPSLVSVPIVHGSEVLGVLNVNNKPGNAAFNEEDLCLFETAGRCIGSMLHVELERARRERVESRFRSLAAKTPLALVGFDVHGTVWLWNHGAHVLTGIAPSDALGSRVPTALLPNQNPEFLSRWINDVRDGRSIEREECVLPGPDNEPQYVLYNLFPLDGNALGVWSGANITREKVAQLSAERRSAEIEATQHVLRDVLLELQSPSVLSSFVDHLAKATNVEKAIVVLRCEENAALECVAAHGLGPIGDMTAWYSAIELLLKQALDGHAIISNVPMPENTHARRFLREFRIRSVAAAPIWRHGKIAGAIAVFNRRQGNFERVDLPVLQDMANVAGISIQVTDTHCERIRNEQLRTVASMAVTYNHNVNNSLQVIQSEIDLALTSHTMSENLRQSLADIEAAARRIAQVNEHLRMVIHPTFREYPGGGLMLDVGGSAGSSATAH